MSETRGSRSEETLHEEELARARGWLELQATHVPLALPQMLSHGVTRRTRVRVGATALVLAALACWGVNLALHPFAGRACAWLTWQELLRMSGMPAVVLLAVLPLLFVTRAGAQMFVRAVLWSELTIGLVVSVDEPGLAPLAAPALAVGCGLALLLLGDLGTEAEKYRPPFHTPALRAALSALLVLTVADLLTLVSVGFANRWLSTDLSLNVPSLVCMAILGISMLGLYHLRAWGLGTSLAASLLILGLALTRSDWVPLTLGRALTVTALAQVALATLGLVGLWGRGPAGSERLLRGAAVVTRLAILAAILLSLGWSLWGVDPATIERACSN